MNPGREPGWFSLPLVTHSRVQAALTGLRVFEADRESLLSVCDLSVRERRAAQHTVRRHLSVLGHLSNNLVLVQTLRAVLLSKHTEYERKQRSPAQPGRSHTGHGVSGEDESFLRSFACLLSLVFKVRVCLKSAGTAAEALESFY